MKSMLRRCLVPAACTAVLSATALTAAAADSMLFASDVHNEIGRLQNVVNYYGDYDFEVIGLVGDYASGNHIVDSEWQNTWGVLWYETWAEPIMIEGNHDHLGDDSYHYWTHSTGAWTEYGDQSEIFVINAPDFSNAASYLEDFFANYGGYEVVVIMSHYPLHSARSGIDTTAAKNIFNVLQKYGRRYDIVYLWGHTHQRSEGASDYDANVNYLTMPGSTIGGTKSVITENTTVATNFAYVNAGYILPRSDREDSKYTIVNIDEYYVDFYRLTNTNGTVADAGSNWFSRATCGNGTCESDEDACTCYEDCGWAGGSCTESDRQCYCDDLCQLAGNADCCQDMIAVQGCY